MILNNKNMRFMKVNFHFSPNLKCQITERLIVIFPLKRERERRDRTNKQTKRGDIF